MYRESVLAKEFVKEGEFNAKLGDIESKFKSIQNEIDEKAK